MNFAAIAVKETTLSPVCEGREKTTTEAIMKNYPDGITVLEFDIVTMQNEKTKEIEPVPVIAFKENPDVFFFGGALLERICQSWIAAYDGDIETASKELKRSGGVKMKFRATRTRSGNNFTAIDIVQ